MRTKIAIFVLFCLAIIGSAETYVLVRYSKPQDSNVVLWAFFISLFLMLWGWLSILIYLFRRFVLVRRTFVSIGPSVRQGIIISTSITILLFFSSLKVLTIWEVIPIIISALLIELFFQADKTTHHETSKD